MLARVAVKTMADISSTVLGETLSAQIKANGPMSLGDYMAACMADPEHGYYHQQNPFGTDGDFITAPEISGMFGEICGLYLAHMYEIAMASVLGQSGSSSNAAIVELGPGRGTLMRDMHHAWAQLMPALTTHSVHFIETSERLRAQQADTMRATGAALHWHNDVSGLPSAPLFGIANEFFDALPQDQIIARNGEWHHRLVGLDTATGGLGFVDGPLLDQDHHKDTLPNAPSDGTIVEFCPAAETIVAHLARHIATNGGAMLIIDYGRNGNTGDSLQAVADHQPVDPFFEPGRADLSHWVDFAALGRGAARAGARLIGPVPQGRFLMRVGLAARAEQAAATADPETRRALLAAIDRLTSPAQMGEAFKVALLVPAGEGLPSGFETM